MTPEEQALERELRAHVEHMSVKLGERSTESHWELADATDYVATAWEAMGFAVERQGYDVGDVVAQNLEVSLQAGEINESVIVGAHYDTGPETSGPDSATGIAALLVVSKALVDERFRRRVRFVAYSLGEAPHSTEESLGSLRHARKLAAAGDKVHAMIGLDSLGRFSEQDDSQKPLPGLDLALPSIGDFLLILGTEESQQVGSALSDACSGSGGVELVKRTHRDDAEPPLASDDWPYRRLGVPAVLITDTKRYRTLPADDAPRHLDFARLTRFVGCLSDAIAQLADAGEPA